MKLEKEFLREVIFPVGGIGAGSVGISGNGTLAEWEIFNHADKGRINRFSHFAVRAERNGKVEAVKILNGDLNHDLNGEGMRGSYGHGPKYFTLCGLPHFRNCVFNGEFPVAEITFSDVDFPAEVKLSAWSPFVPGESDLASMPAAFFEISFRNTSSNTMTFSGIGAMSNPWDGENSGNRLIRQDGTMQLIAGSGLDKTDFEYGETALTVSGNCLSGQEYWYRGAFHDALEVYWYDLQQPGAFHNRRLETQKGFDTGMLCSSLELAPGETGKVRFVLSWYVPNCRNTWSKEIDAQVAQAALPGNAWKNYYAKLCSGAADAGMKMMKKFEEIKTQVFRFRDALHSSTIPAPCLQGAAANLAVLITPVVLRLEDGTVWGWEGINANSGSCAGTCQHVWNYAQALALLFPDLERTIRISQIKYNINPEGAWKFRLQLPLGIGAAPSPAVRACADGTFGEIMKCFREWKVSGDTTWMKSIYPQLKKVMEYTWSKANQDLWDPEQSGVLTGRQHHTLDLQLFGPSGWLNGHYLGALKALAVMAEACGDEEFAALCRRIFEKGKKWTETHLFNGEYFEQLIDVKDQSVLLKFRDQEEKYHGSEAAEQFMRTYWDEEHREIKYQPGSGCGIDCHLGQWYASLYGLGEILDPEKIHASLNAVFKYNFKSSFRNFANTWRVFALNDEGGCLICTWPEGRKKPVIPLTYNTEVMTGFEWAAAAHLVMTGELAKGEKLAAAIRERYDGAKRNPWNEIECGNNYARSMASFAMLQAYSGFCYDMTRGMIGFKPVLPGNFRCFWSLGCIWGTFEQKDSAAELNILHGKAEFQSFRIPAKKLLLNGRELPGVMKTDEWHLNEPQLMQSGDVLVLYR